MPRSALLAVLLLTPAFAADPKPADPPKAAAFDGEVQPLADALKKLGAKPDADTAGVALVTAGGEVFTLVKDDASRMLFLDPDLHNRDVRLTATRLPGTQCLKVEKVQTVKGGKVFDVDYWCDRCQLAAPQPGKCVCCGDQVVLRELPAKTKPAK
jgi:hypothetical protein